MFLGNMHLFFLATAFFQEIPLSRGVVCGTNGRACVASNQYQTCVMVNGVPAATDGLVITCPAGQICSPDGQYPCIVNPNPAPATTTTTSTTTVAPTTPLCTEESTYPGPQCNQYYRCFAVMWWFSSELLTCPAGQAYDQTSGQCATSTTCNV